MRNGMEVMSLLYLRGAETDGSHVSVQVQHWTGSTKAQKDSPFLLLYECVNASFPGGHLERQIRDGQRQLRGDGTVRDPQKERALTEGPSGPTWVTMMGDRSFRFWMWVSRESRSALWVSGGSS